MLFEAVQREDLVLGLDLQRRHGLLTNDSLDLAPADRLGIRDVATAERNFDGIEELRVHRASDVKAGL
ncbi:MAG TPA: hypothetical protein VHC86_06430 [Opitutaceae bacterium]|nr:hypothetical protein [Opitutaceae bacterium]